MSVHGIALAYKYLSSCLYEGLETALEPVSSSTPTKSARNEAIRQRYKAGETFGELAIAYGISEQRIHQIVNHRRR
jgi:hypothetical protein